MFICCRKDCFLYHNRKTNVPNLSKNISQYKRNIPSFRKQEYKNIYFNLYLKFRFYSIEKTLLSRERVFHL